MHHSNLEPAEHCVVVLGASPKPTRYSYQAVKLLQEKGYRVLPVHPKATHIGRIEAISHLASIRETVHTLTLYVGPERSRGMIDDIVTLAPGRVILNPGAESPDLERALEDAQIAHEHACTLVLLRTSQF